MRKSSLLIVAIIALLTSCSKNSYTVDGEFAEDTYNGQSIYLYKIDSLDANATEFPQPVDSAKIENKKFKIQGTDDRIPMVALLSTEKFSLTNEESKAPIATIILEEGTVNVKFEGAKAIGSGTPCNDDFSKIQVAMLDLSDYYANAQEVGGFNELPVSEDGKSGEVVFQEKMQTWKDATFDFAKKNMTNRAGEFIFFSSFQTMFTPAQIIELINISTEKFQSKPEIKELKEMLDTMNGEVPADPSELQSAVDVELLNAEGKSSQLFAVIEANEYTLVDFWASWCGPCMQEVPNLKKAYEKYKSKGFQIVGISLDQDTTEWKKAVKKNSMNWLQFFDKEGQAANKYGIKSIPFTILVDKKGNIVGRNFRGNDLDQKLAELLK